jgi:hypothetical protein
LRQIRGHRIGKKGGAIAALNYFPDLFDTALPRFQMTSFPSWFPPG